MRFICFWFHSSFGVVISQGSSVSSASSWLSHDRLRYLSARLRASDILVFSCAYPDIKDERTRNLSLHPLAYPIKSAYSLAALLQSKPHCSDSVIGVSFIVCSSLSHTHPSYPQCLHCPLMVRSGWWVITSYPSRILHQPFSLCVLQSHCRRVVSTPLASSHTYLQAGST